MTTHRILVPQHVSRADIGPGMRKDSDFSSRLEPDLPPRPGAIALFRPRSTALAPLVPRSDALQVVPPPQEPRHDPAKVWESLGKSVLNPDFLAGNGVFALSEQNPVTAQFDILRTRVWQAMQERGWKRIAVTSPTHGCGKSLVAANLALALARLPSCRTVLMDLELRHPDLARLFGVHCGPLHEVLTGEQPLESHLRRVGDRLALALNGEAVAAGSETLLDPRSVGTLKAIVDHLAPSAVVIDLPHALGNDDVISVLPQVDCVLLVADATRTTAEDVRACERLFEGRVPLMGVVLNRADDGRRRRYRYGKGKR